MAFVGIISCACLTVMGLGVANAQTVLNPSFELDVLSPGGYTSGNGTVTDWSSTTTGFGNGIQYFTTDNFDSASPLPAPADGNQALYIFAGDVYQDVGALQSNTTYTLTLALGSRLDQPGNGIFELINGIDNTGTVLAVSPTITPTAGTFELETLTYSTGSDVSGDLTIDLESGGTGQAIFDNIQLTAQSVPEPSSLALLFIGLSGIGVMVRSYRMSQNS